MGKRRQRHSMPGRHQDHRTDRILLAEWSLYPAWLKAGSFFPLLEQNCHVSLSTMVYPAARMTSFEDRSPPLLQADCFHLFREAVEHIPTSNRKLGSSWEPLSTYLERTTKDY